MSERKQVMIDFLEICADLISDFPNLFGII